MVNPQNSVASDDASQNNKNGTGQPALQEHGYSDKQFTFTGKNFLKLIVFSFEPFFPGLINKLMFNPIL